MSAEPRPGAGTGSVEVRLEDLHRRYGDVRALDGLTLTLAPGEVPETGVPVVQLLVRAGLATSGKDARRLIAEGGARLDDAALEDPGLLLGAAELTRARKLSAGRKRHALVRLRDAGEG